MSTIETPDLNKLSLDDLLLRTQTNITQDPKLGYEYALEAYKRARIPMEAEKNPTAAGIAARQAGFRAAQAGKDEKTVWKHFNDSLAAFSSEKIPKEHARERIGTYLLAGRAALLLNTGNPVRWFRAADRQLTAQHEPRSRWDPFGTINDKFWATHEAMNGKALTGAGLALRGIYRARRAERKDTPPQEHKAFVKKQTKLNMAAGLLAISRVVSFGPIKKLREKIAEKIIKGPTKHHKKH